VKSFDWSWSRQFKLRSCLEVRFQNDFLNRTRWTLARWRRLKGKLTRINNGKVSHQTNSDESSDLHYATAIFQQRHPLLHPPASADMQYVRQITKCVTHRAAALLATAIHSLWYLRATTKGHTPLDMGPVTIGCNGSVIERYPQFRSQTQRYLNQLTTLTGAGCNIISLEMAMESALFGAAVAVASLEGS